MDNTTSSNAPVRVICTDEIDDDAVASPSDTAIQQQLVDTAAAPIADPESSDDEATPDEDDANDEVHSSDATTAAEETPAAEDETATAAAAEAANIEADDGASPSTAAAGSAEADRVSTDNPILQEINRHSNQLCRLIMVCRRKLSYNIQARDTIIGLDGILARSPTVAQRSSPSSFVNAMIDIYKNLIAYLPRAFDLKDIVTIRRNLFKFYNLDHVLATRCCRRSERLAFKRRQQRRKSN